MNKNLLVFIGTTVLLVATMVIADGWIYSATALAATIIVAVIRHFHSRVLKISRWAKENPGKRGSALRLCLFA